MTLCNTEPLCESQSVELIFAQLFEKVFALCLVYGGSQDTHLARFISIIGVCNLIYCIRAGDYPRYVPLVTGGHLKMVFNLLS